MTNLPGSGTILPSTATPEHRAAGPEAIRAAVLTISDTRTTETDTSGQYLQNELVRAGHEVVEYLIVKDDALELRTALMRLLHRTDLIVTTGGTGIAGRDVTTPVVESMIVKPIPGFGELFRMLSYQEVKGAAMLSRATGGLTHGALLFSLPGSLNAVQTAWEGILKDELGHLVFEVLRQSQAGVGHPGESSHATTLSTGVIGTGQPATGLGATGVGGAGIGGSGLTGAGLAGTGLAGTGSSGMHVNQGAAAGIGRHAGVIGSETHSAPITGLGRHGTVKDDTQQ